MPTRKLTMRAGPSIGTTGGRVTSGVVGRLLYTCRASSTTARTVTGDAHGRRTSIGTISLSRARQGGRWSPHRGVMVGMGTVRQGRHRQLHPRRPRTALGRARTGRHSRWLRGRSADMAPEAAACGNQPRRPTDPQSFGKSARLRTSATRGPLLKWRRTGGTQLLRHTRVLSPRRLRRPCERVVSQGDPHAERDQFGIRIGTTGGSGGSAAASIADITPRRSRLAPKDLARRRFVR